MTDSTGRLARWRSRLSKFDFDVTNSAGLKLQCASAQHHLQTTGEYDALLKDDLPLFIIDPERDNIGILVTNAISDKIILLDAQDKESVDTPPTIEKLIIEQARDDYCNTATINIGQSGSDLNNDQRELLV